MGIEPGGPGVRRGPAGHLSLSPKSLAQMPRQMFLSLSFGDGHSMSVEATWKGFSGGWKEAHPPGGLILLPRPAHTCLIPGVCGLLSPLHSVLCCGGASCSRPFITMGRVATQWTALLQACTCARLPCCGCIPARIVNIILSKLFLVGS